VPGYSAGYAAIIHDIHFSAAVSNWLLLNICIYLMMHRTEVISNSSQATYSTQCIQFATWLSNITTATTGRKTIGSETWSDLLMMGVKTPETCWGAIDYQ
jgi:hypothetical protein